ncbi:unnamed protein product [Ascophyllum nodosum]
MKKVLFWSDVRTNMDSSGGRSENSPPSDLDIIGNTAMNYSWLKRLTANYDGRLFSMLKYRMPYFDELSLTGTPLAETQELEKQENDTNPLVCRKMLPWFDGTVYLQAFAGYGSAESRLWVTLTRLNHQ